MQLGPNLVVKDKALAMKTIEGSLLPLLEHA